MSFKVQTAHYLDKVSDSVVEMLRRYKEDIAWGYSPGK